MKWRLIAAFAFLSPTVALAIDLKRSARVVDGDTLVVQEMTVRLHGIDAAESGQRCVGDSRRITRPGDSAMKLLETLSVDGVSCSGDRFDDYGRLIAVCRTTDGKDIEQLLVAAGWAWTYVKYSADYVPDETLAKEMGLGVWATACEPPWMLRSKQWESAVQRAPSGCPIKSNISNNGRIYHTPWSRDYAKTKVNAAKGKRWFCSEKEALKAGWRPPRG